jgi:putative transcriptional regulator
MHRLGLVDKTTMREFDVRTLTKIEDLSAKQIQALRRRAGVSQSVFARVLTVTTNDVSQLERGAKRPAGHFPGPLGSPPCIRLAQNYISEF